MKQKLTLSFFLSVAILSNTYSQSQSIVPPSNFMIREERGLSNLSSALVANESFPGTPKFELDLFCCGSTPQESQNLIWLSVATESGASLSNGTYKYSSKTVNQRRAFDFQGSVKANSAETKISDGSVKVQIQGEDLQVDYNFLLEDGSKVSGKYLGKFQTADWRRK